MATEFSIGVIIGGAISGAFRSAVTNTRQTLDSIGETTRRLQERQNGLTRAMERYGQIGSRASQRMNSDLQRVGRTMEQLQRQQNRLASASAVSDAARANRISLYAKGAETYAVARTVAAPVISSVTQFASYESSLRDIAVTGDLSRAQEKQIGQVIRRAAIETNQLQDTLLEGMNTLVAAGMEPIKASGFMALLGRTATASKSDINDLAKMSLAFESLKITGDVAMKEAFNRAVFGAKAGRFELKDLAQYLPEMATAFAAKGIYGQEAVSQIIASLEVGREGAGSEGEAATNMRNWLAAMNRGDTSQKYAKAGVDYQTSMQRYVASGSSQYEASLMIADRFIKGKGDAFLKKWQAAGAKGDKESQQKLMESFGLSEVFTDIQTVNHLLSMRQRWDQYKEIKQGMDTENAQGSIDRDSASQNDTLEARWRRTQIAFKDSAIGIGESLRPALISLGDTLIPLLDQAAKWIAANPEIVKGVVTAAAGLLAFKAASIGTKLALNLLLSPVVDLWHGAMLLRSKWLLLRESFGVGGRARQWLGTFSRLGSGALSLGRTLAGSLLRGITLVGRAVMVMGRALLMNPIGLLITGIAVGAYLIYRYWGPISNWFRARWSDIKTAFSGGIGGVSKLIINWSPLGLFYKVFAGVMKYFGIDMPNKFTEFGGNIINGLVNGIRNRWEAAKASVSELGSNISGWFADKLGIHSPSRVFMGFGDNIVQGAAIGISRTTPLAAQAGQQLARVLTPDISAVTSSPVAVPRWRSGSLARVPQIPDIPSLPDTPAIGRPGNKNAGSNGFHVTFSPNIYLNGQKTASTPEVASALNLSLRELENMLQRIVAQQQRREYA